MYTYGLHFSPESMTTLFVKMLYLNTKLKVKKGERECVNAVNLKNMNFCSKTLNLTLSLTEKK